MKVLIKLAVAVIGLAGVTAVCAQSNQVLFARLNTDVTPPGVLLTWPTGPTGGEIVISVDGGDGLKRTARRLPRTDLQYRHWSGGDLVVNPPGYPAAGQRLVYRLTPSGNTWTSVDVEVWADAARQPVARIAAPATAAPGQTITLDGSASTNVPDRTNALSYRWTRVIDSVATRLATTTAELTDTLPAEAGEGVTYQLEVISVVPAVGGAIAGWRSQTVSHTVQLSGPTAVIAAVSGTQAANTRVTLDGSGSTANTGDTTLGDDAGVNAYQWTQVTAANTNTALDASHANYVQLTGANTDMASFTVPERFPASFSATLHFSLVVTDGDGESEPAYVSVMVSGANDPPNTPVITVMHTPPTADATAIRLDVVAARIAPSIPAMGDTAEMNSRVVLSVTSTDPDTGDSVMTYNWTLVTEARGTDAVSTGHELAAFSQTLERAPSRSLDGGGTLPAGRTLSFNAPTFVDADGMPADLGCESPTEGDAVCPARTTPLLLHFRVTATDDNTANSDSAWITIAVAAPSTGNSEVVDRAILPHVIRALERQVHNSIFQRIQQRQRADGKWK